MDQGNLGPLGPVSRLTLGGGGLGQLWGRTDRDECVATLRAAVDGGIDLIDLAYRYGNGEAEEVFGIAFDGRPPTGLRVTSKCLLGNTPADRIEEKLRASIHDSLARLRLERLDLFLLHSNVAPDGHHMQRHPDAGARMTAHGDFTATVRPCFERFVAEGLIDAWGLTGIGHPDAIINLLADSPAPAVVQCIANAMDSPGALKFYYEVARPRDVIAAAQANNVGVMGIRAVQAGALTDAIDRDLPPDHPEVRDFNAAGDYRALAADLGMSAAVLGHRNALSLPGVDTVVLGAKNREELSECLAAADAGPLPGEIMERVDGCFPDR